MSMGKLPISDPNDNQSPAVKYIKAGVLIALCCQNAGHALLARYSQGILKESYSSSEVVLFGEFVKLVFSGYAALTDRSETDAIGNGVSKLIWLILNSRKIIVLVVLYSIANVMSYYALARVEASVYSVVSQLKIFTTAAFSVIFLGRNVSMTKWRALILLVIGCILVASPSFNKPDCDCGAQIPGTRRLSEVVQSIVMMKEFEITEVGTALLSTMSCYWKQRSLLDSSSSSEGSSFETILGVGAVLIMVSISGYSSVYFEGMLKKSGEKITIWERNFQLAFYSIIFLVGMIVWEDQISVLSSQFSSSTSPVVVRDIYVPFRGWTFNTFMVSLIQAGGGLLVAATLKYADSILKTLATSGAIVLSSILGYFLLDGSLDIFVCLGAIATILAIFNYTFST